MSGLNNVEGLDKRVKVTNDTFTNLRALRPNVPDLCEKCEYVISALTEAASEKPDATELIANCVPQEESINANISIVVLHGGEAGNEILPMKEGFCCVAHNASRGSGM